MPTTSGVGPATCRNCSPRSPGPMTRRLTGSYTTRVSPCGGPGKPDGIDGYMSGSRQRVWEITSAIYTAISNLGIRYSLPPASFERDGQKVRLPSQILDGRIATCLDLSLLFASALEQAGLNPVVALPKEHAVAGVWLQPEDLSSIVVDEAEVLRKRAELHELILVETTSVTNHPSPPFSRAVKAAMDSLSLEHDETFSAAVDIRRARAHRITPLGLMSADAGRVAPSPTTPMWRSLSKRLPNCPPSTARSIGISRQRRRRDDSSGGSASCWTCLHAIPSSTTAPLGRV